MKTIKQWFDEYSVSHQNETNIQIHFICVPAIYFSIVGMLLSIPVGFLGNIAPTLSPLLINWAAIAILFVMLFYVFLSIATALKMLFFSVVCLVANYYLGMILPLFYVSLAIFAVAWVGQFYGHKIEGKKPSFLKDIQFLLIGPAWVMHKMFN
ncbi:hypothetical protein NBRC110019_27530 [Neptunitalea chrysea]|uniref:DUF962 domain-containing protein n=1 Tax=Neptunitalea chrysea TaxID=1647581 RepID=A0A9W6B8P6_9FLAO|nr:Mpo1-like protein [Neptunitalea chrysea]GLB53712.1 hypothetical protein NBRC110019_27530 [Neptunitalea chrysea]